VVSCGSYFAWWWGWWRAYKADVGGSSPSAPTTERLEHVLAAVDEKLEELDRAHRRLIITEVAVSAARGAKLSP
jgi:hypothetical protein